MFVFEETLNIYNISTKNIFKLTGAQSWQPLHRLNIIKCVYHGTLRTKGLNSSVGNQELNQEVVINSHEQLVGCGSFVRGKPNIVMARQKTKNINETI